MRIRVLKFGGTSLSTEQARTRVIHHIKQAALEEVKPVVVVSAMGRLGEPYATDTLLQWIKQNGDNLPAREQDMLLCCGETIAAATLCSLLQAEGIPASVLNGAQAGIRTDDRFGDAHIVSIEPGRIIELAEQDNVAIVTGFQGVTERGDATTLGRGGSDTTATALGAALKADVVDIFTDVDGILTADPRLVAEARPLQQVTYAEICNMAHNGAKVIHPRAVELAMQAGVPIRVRSTFADGAGTLVASPEALRQQSVGLRDRPVTGIAHTAGITQVQVANVSQQLDLQVSVFKAMAASRISVDFISVNPSRVVYTVRDEDADRAVRVLREIGCEPAVLRGCAKVSVIGGGMAGVPGVMARIVEALTGHEIAILQSADSHTTIWVLVRGEDCAKAAQVLHNTFGLHLT